MGDLASAIQRASKRTYKRSESRSAWDSMSPDDRVIVSESLRDGTLGTQLMSRTLRDAGHNISRHFLDGIKRGEVLN